MMNKISKRKRQNRYIELSILCDRWGTSDEPGDVLLKDGGDEYAMFLVILSRFRKNFWDFEFVCATMADDETWLLKEDGYLSLDCECKSIIYHPNINVVLITTGNAQVCVFDVNSGLILQRSFLSGKCQRFSFFFIQNHPQDEDTCDDDFPRNFSDGRSAKSSWSRSPSFLPSFHKRQAQRFSVGSQNFHVLLPLKIPFVSPYFPQFSFPLKYSRILEMRNRLG